MGRIVVGVDGSEEADRALRWAVEEGRMRGSTVQVVYAYEYTAAWSLYDYPSEDFLVAAPPRERGGSPGGEASPWDEEAAARATGLLRDMVARLGDVGDVHIEPRAVEDRRPARALVELSDEAELLVVGSRGRGGFAGVLLGSVSQHCANHAACPVVIIPPPRRRGPAQ